MAQYPTSLDKDYYKFSRINHSRLTFRLIYILTKTQFLQFVTMSSFIVFCTNSSQQAIIRILLVLSSQLFTYYTPVITLLYINIKLKENGIPNFTSCSHRLRSEFG